jgi:hypothetical protein
MSSTSGENDTPAEKLVEFPPATSLNLPGGKKGGAVRGEPTFDSIDLSKPGDLALVHRAVGGGWDVPQHIRDALCEQFTPALEKYTDTMHNGATPSARHRAMKHLIKVVMLGAKMEAANRIAEGQPKGWFPYLRKRSPEKREPRSRPTTDAETLEMLAEKLEPARSGMTERGSTSPPRRVAPEGDPTRYVYVNRTRCPRCQSDDLEGYGTLTGADGVITRYTRCVSCNHRVHRRRGVTGGRHVDARLADRRPEDRGTPFTPVREQITRIALIGAPLGVKALVVVLK